MYTYNAYVTDVYDGDTITVDIDLGFGIKITNQKIRLFGINAPELKGKTKAEGIKSRDKLTKLILNKQVKIETIKDKKEKYGRLLGKIWIEDTMVNDVLLKEGFAISYMDDAH
jgi:micrococcal nuclease